MRLSSFAPVMWYRCAKTPGISMRILLITPAPPRSRAGNRATAARWAARLRELGHKVHIAIEYDGQPADLMIALHAWRSAGSVTRFRELYPQKPLIVAITGTDAYRFIHSDPDTTIRSMQLADQLVGLHDLIAHALPQDQRHKVNVVYQSAQPIAGRSPYRRYFHVAVLGHLRDEKDPLRPAMAAALLPPDSRIHVHQYGKAHTPHWAEQARREMLRNARYTWHEEVPHYRVRQVYRRTNVLVLPSRMEGGANVISEAIVAGVPIIASHIEGSVGLLGENYPGYYPVEDEIALAGLLRRAELEVGFYRQLETHCIRRQAMFTVDGEREGWRRLLARMGFA
jgi:putative glycosyltransferase (TIGR04348 family)